MTTGVFCRPSCGSRRPLKANVRFFKSAAEARAAGFRACKKCKPGNTAWSSPLERVRTHIEKNLDRPVRLEELGRVAGMSPFTVQRLFKREMGVSPLGYQRALRAGSLRKALKQGDNVTTAIYEAGFGSSSRAYEGAQLGMTPARFAKGGKGEQIGWADGALTFWLGDCGRNGARAVLAGAGGDGGRGGGEFARRISAGRVAAGCVAGEDGGCCAARMSALRREERRSGAAGSARDGVSTARVAGSARHSTGRNAQLQPTGAGDGH